MTAFVKNVRRYDSLQDLDLYVYFVRHLVCVMLIFPLAQIPSDLEARSVNENPNK
jgi:hypothetical protein